MGNILSSVTLTDILVCVPTIAIFIYFKSRRTLPYPPGPKGLPILGNALDVPQKRPWVTYTAMARETGSPLIHLNMMGTHVMIINDFKTIREIFDRRAHRYAGRPRMPMFNEVAGYSWAFSNIHGERWKTSRRQFDTYFKEAESRKLRPHEIAATHHLLKLVLEAPGDFVKHFHFQVCRMIFDIGYGISIENADDPFVTLMEINSKTANQTGGANLVDIIPWIQHLPAWLPGMGWKAKTTNWKEVSHQTRDVPFDAVKRAIRNNTARPSVASQLLETVNDDPVKEEIVKSTIGTMLGAATDTTISTLETFVACMIAWPEVQKAAQAELDRVIGHDRLPDFSDQPRLPFIQALIQELLRYHCTVPLAIPHFAMEDDIWVHQGKQYFIPKGSIVFGNTWALCRDPEVYPEPDTFNPWRFLIEDGQINHQIQDPAPAAFGYRPRQCPGRWMAEDVLYIAISSLLFAFNFETADGQPFPTDYDKIFNPGFIMTTYPFQAKISPRSEAIADLVRHVDI